MRLRAAPNNPCIVCVYVPHDQRLHLSRANTLAELEALLKNAPRGDCLLVMGDLNCRLPRSHGKRTGRWCVHIRANAGGVELLEIMEGLDLQVASTRSQLLRNHTNGTYIPNDSRYNPVCDVREVARLTKVLTGRGKHRGNIMPTKAAYGKPLTESKQLLEAWHEFFGRKFTCADIPGAAYMHWKQPTTTRTERLRRKNWIHACGCCTTTRHRGVSWLARRKARALRHRAPDVANRCTRNVRMGSRFHI